MIGKSVPGPRAGAENPSRATPGPKAPLRRKPAIKPIQEGRAPALYKSSLSRTRRKPTSDTATKHLVEVVYFFLYDVGRSVDLKKAAALIPAHADMGIVKRRDTPASLTLPKPLILQLGESECMDFSSFECFSAQAKIYEEGALTVIVRVKARIPFGELHRVKESTIVSNDDTMTIESYVERSFKQLFDALRPAVLEPFNQEKFDRETYTAFCLLECPEDPAVFLSRNRDYTAALLIDEESGSELHESQIAATLGQPFSYHRGDLAVFDLDRCLIIDPAADYEDLLLIVENANYQLLELRVLDKLLDTWLDEAEEDIRHLYGSTGQRRRVWGSVKEKFAHIQGLRFDALFILENLENSSKIIGDYYLGQVYERLCGIFNTEGWKWSVERRLETLQSVYEMVNADTGQRRMYTLEVVFIVVCIIFPIIQIIQVMLAN